MGPISNRKIIEEIFKSLNAADKRKKVSNSVKLIIGFTIGLIIFGSTVGILIKNNIKVKKDIFYYLLLLTRLPADFRFQITSNTDWWGKYGEGIDYCTNINRPAGSYNISIKGDNAWGYFHKKSESGYIKVVLYVNNELVDYKTTSEPNKKLNLDEDKPYTIIDLLVLFIALDTRGKLGNTFRWICWGYYTKPPL